MSKEVSMSSPELSRIHERIDETNQLINRIAVAAETNVELCKQCRPKVMGNGKEGLEARLARVEENQIADGKARSSKVENTFIVSKTWLTVILSVSGVVASGVGAAVAVVVKQLLKA
jgi:hypothetical protein